MEKVTEKRGERGIDDRKSIEVVERFFEAFDILLEMGKIKTEHAFCIENNINRRNFKRLRDQPHRKFNLWMFALVIEHGISGDWILTGKGKMFK